MQEQHLEKPGKSMDYKLNITEHADELLDELMYLSLIHIYDRFACIQCHPFYCCQQLYTVSERESGGQCHNSEQL